MPPETQNNNENAENSENQNLNLSTTQNSNYNKKNVLIFAFIFVLVIIGIYFSYRFLNTQMFPHPNQEAPQVIQERGEMLNWKTYRNEKYGFEFKYPPLMDGFRVVESDNNIKFYLDEPSSEWSSDDYNIFNIEIMTPEIWNEYLSNDSPRPIFLATSTNQVFGYWKGHDCPDNYCYLYENSQRILSTFKFIDTSNGENRCESYRFGNCPEYCVEYCIPSYCIEGGPCTDDCGGVGSCRTPTKEEINP